MALAKVDILNNALRIIAADLIADPLEASESARQANGVYDLQVQIELSANPWNFAKVQAALPASLTPPIYDYAYAFQLPSDFVRLVTLGQIWVFSVIRGIDPHPIPLYDIQGKQIYTGLAAPLQITYLKDCGNDPSLWSPLFANAVAAGIAKQIAMPLTKSATQVKMAEDTYKMAIASAVRVNAIQLPPRPIPDASWITARDY